MDPMLEELQGTVAAERATGSFPPPVPGPGGDRAQLAVAVLFLVNGAAVGSWVPHIPERAHALGLNAAQLGSVLLAGGIGALCAMPVSGKLVRSCGSRWATVVSGILFPALLSAAILTPSVPWLVAVLFLTGFSAAAMDVSMNAHGALVERLLGRRTISLFHAIFSVGCFAGAGIQSFLMARRVPDNLLVPVFGGALVVLTVCVAPLLVSRAAERAHHDAEPAPARRTAHTHRGVRALLHTHMPHPRLLLLGLLCFSTMVSEGAMGDWSALFLRVVHHLPNGTAGYGYTCFAGLMVIGRFSGDRIVARVGELRTLRFGGALSAGGLLLVLLTHGLAPVLLGFTLAGAGLANASPILYRTAATVPGFAPGEGLATAVGVGYAGLLIGPPLLGFLGHAAGLSSIFAALLGLSVILSLGAGLIRGALRGWQPVSAADAAHS